MSHSHSHSHSQPHGHAHGHSHATSLSWVEAWSSPLMKALVGGLAVAAVATAAGVVALWPDGSGQRAAVEESRQIGLVTDMLAATVSELHDAPCSYDDSFDCRTLVFTPEEGPDAGLLVALPEFQLGVGSVAPPEVEVGSPIIIGYEPRTDSYYYADQERRGSLRMLAALFVLAVLALGRFRGVLALASLGFTVVVLIGFIAPSVLDGNNPVLVAVVGASLIAMVGLTLTHGPSPTTAVALAGTLAALAVTLVVAWYSFEAANFTGLATEEGLTLPFVATRVDLSALLLGGAVIGTMGALDDVTVTQAVTVAELKRQQPSAGFTTLFQSGMHVGREHIGATVNTLLLAYAGASLPLILLFVISNQSLGVVVNSEVIAVEVVRTLSGSIGLIAAVPLTTSLVAALVQRSTPLEVADSGHSDSDSESESESESESGSESDSELNPEPEMEPEPVEGDWDRFGPEASGGFESS